ncbi:signal peptidase I [Citricoccus sp. SGAir0253]|uniref:signal peptidase I n=1 Tax=Citricoccus sp. SGAir0253 TaxID=2567881 RepID=UPI0010CD0150|nr:signal peptidase I [Citricoccus sp. SGAir0253]QCU76997.1 signal peptidase I [Citricoccus sp. SGAir0253]
MSPHAPRRVPAWLHWAGQGLSLVALCLAVLAALVLVVVPVATGSQTYSVLTSSMAPHYAPGTFIVVRPQEFRSLQVGDVITYQLASGKPDVVTHRIVSVTADQAGERMLVTQGDNNALADAEPVREVQVRGALLYAVPYVGFVANTLGQAKRAPVVTVLAFGLIGLGMASMVRGLVRDRREALARRAGEEAAPEVVMGSVADLPAHPEWSDEVVDAGPVTEPIPLTVPTAEPAVPGARAAGRPGPRAARGAPASGDSSATTRPETRTPAHA